MMRSPKKTTSLLRVAKPRAAARVKLISTDFDGTLVSQKLNDPALLEFFELLKEQRRVTKVKWVINTGRSWDTLEGEILARSFPSLPDWLVLAEREVYKVHREHPVGDYEWNTACSQTHQLLFSATTLFWEGLTDFIQSQTGAETMRDPHSPITIRARNDHEADRIHHYILEQLPAYPNLTVVRNSVYFRFAHQDYTKGSALRRVQAHLGIKPSETMVIGDHHNDLPMLTTESAGWVSCPGNAIPEVKAHVTAVGGYLATQTETRGVIESWRHFLKAG
jgi:hydroxymethylpyrimidine pyrophosphatase-like HAD family hydrolase